MDDTTQEVEAVVQEELILKSFDIRMIEDGVIVSINTESKSGKRWETKEYFVKSLHKVPAFLRNYIKDNISFS